MKTVLRHLRRVALAHAGDGPGDGQLLQAFLDRRDEMAFEWLLRRHGPMVLGVCRRVLGNVHDAEDAFQATFLVLARKAATVRPREMVGHWLHGVAYRTALKARAMNAKRRVKERQAANMALPQPPADGAPGELLARLDAELSRLPEKYRVPLVLCELEGRGRKEVARLLGLPEGTLSWRLAHAKKLLARRLSRYGAVLSGGAVAALLSGEAASACVPAALLHSTARVAVLTAGVVSARVVALTEGVMKAMLLSKLKLVWAVGLAAVVGVGAVGLTYRQAAAQPAPSNAVPRAARATADELDELRLEVAALRKGLEVTRARVKALEGEVRALRGAGADGRPAGNNRRLQFRESLDRSQGGPGGSTGRPAADGLDRLPGQPDQNPQGRPAGDAPDLPEQRDRNNAGRPAGDGLDRVPGQRDQNSAGRPGGDTLDRAGGQPGENSLRRLAEALNRPREDRQAGPLARAEAALRQLRANPSDKQAAEVLERALQQLKLEQKNRLQPDERLPGESQQQGKPVGN
jgi:RNA polymerase sigma-70 factor (ECF subfamily)